MGKRGPKPKGRVDTAWCPELAYAVSLIAADGSLLKGGRHIDFTSKDLDLMRTYCSCLGIAGITIGKKYSGNKQNGTYCRVQFGDVLFYKWLQDIGLSPNKSLTIASLDIPDDYFLISFVVSGMATELYIVRKINDGTIVLL